MQTRAHVNIVKGLDRTIKAYHLKFSGFMWQ